MAEPGIKMDRDVLGYTPSPELQYLSSQLQERYNKEVLPQAATVAAGLAPDAAAEAKKAAADAMKNIAGVDKPQMINAFQSFLAGDIRSMAISLNGGADVPTQAYAPDGSTWTKVFNERKTTQNPYGEVRRYIDANGKEYTREQAEKLVGGPIVSTVEIPLQQQNFYAAQGVAAKDVATAQANEWNRRRVAGAAALRNADFITNTASTLDDILYNNPDIIKSSVNPEVRALIAGIGQLRTGDNKSFVSAVQKLNEFSEGKGSSSDWSNFQKKNGGLTAGINYTEGKGLTNAKGEKIDSRDLDRRIDDTKNSMGSENAIQARKDELLQRAQFNAAKLDPKIINAIQQGVNLEYQKALAIKEVEDAGGIGISRPTLPNEVGDDFVLAGVKNRINRNYGELAKIYGSEVQGLEGEYVNRAPAIGEIEQRIRSNPVVKEVNERNKRSTLDYSKRMSQYLGELNPQTPTAAVAQPGTEITTTAKVPPKAEPGQPVGARNPAKRESANKPKNVLSEIFGN